MAKHKVVESMTDDELRQQLAVCLSDYKRLWSHPESVEYANNELWYRMVNEEYGRRGMLKEWDETVEKFRKENQRGKQSSNAVA